VTYTLSDETLAKMRELAHLRLEATLNPCFATYQGPADPFTGAGAKVQYQCHRARGHDGNHFGNAITIEWSDEESES
jgi:hypothetical protein